MLGLLQQIFGTIGDGTLWMLSEILPASMIRKDRSKLFQIESRLYLVALSRDERWILCAGCFSVSTLGRTAFN